MEIEHRLSIGERIVFSVESTIRLWEFWAWLQGINREGMTMNWRDSDQVKVGYVNRPDLGEMFCDVIRRDRTNDEPHGVTLVRWAHGALMPVSWCHSQSRYVFSPYRDGEPAPEWFARYGSTQRERLYR